MFTILLASMLEIQKERKKMEKKDQRRLFGRSGPPRKRNVFTLSEASLKTLSADDQNMIHEMESEFKRKNNFQRIYPSFAPEVNDYYAQFFEAQRYNNTLCNVWIAACAKGRRPVLAKGKEKKRSRQKPNNRSDVTLENVCSNLESAARLQEKNNMLNKTASVSNDDLKHTSRSNSTESARTSDFHPSSSSVEEGESESGAGPSSNDSVFEKNSAVEHRTYEQDIKNPYLLNHPNPPVVPVKEKMQQPPKKIDFRYRSIVAKRDNFGSHPIGTKNHDSRKFDSRIGGVAVGGILKQVVKNINGSTVNGDVNSNISVAKRTSIAVGSASKAVYQAREIQANPSAYKSAADIAAKDSAALNSQKEIPLYKEAPSADANTHAERIFPRQLNSIERPRQGTNTQPSAQNYSHFPQPPSHFTARPHTIGISSREKRITVNRVYQQSGTQIKGMGGIGFLLQKNGNNNLEGAQRVALTLNGRKTSIDGARSAIRKF